MYQLTHRRVLVQIKRLEKFINDWRMVPATGDRRNLVFLALWSKALTVGRAICVLVKEGFPAEAFGLSRSLIDIFFSVRYMSNRDTEARQKRFVQYLARVQKEWMTLNDKYFPGRSLKLSASDRDLLKLAAKYPSRHQWIPERGQAKFMAGELDTTETNETGQPLTVELDYDVFYFWTSHYVHVTIHALPAHAARKGDAFSVRGDSSKEERLGQIALFNVLGYLAKISIQACRGIREEQPEQILQDMFAMKRAFARQSPTENAGRATGDHHGNQTKRRVRASR
jgi:Family of unknown function (DUF5677)